VEALISQQPVAIQVQQVAQLVERPIEVVEYQRLALSVTLWTDTHSSMAPNHRPWSRLGVSLQAYTRALGNYGHLSRETTRTNAGTG